jgi:magnesium transporter
MIRSFVFSDGKVAGRDLEVGALRLVRADKGLLIWVDLDDPTEAEAKAVLEDCFQFHPLSIEDCLTPSSLPKIEDYDDYLFMVTHAVEYKKAEKFRTAEIDMFLGRDYLVTFHRAALKPVAAVMERCERGGGPRGVDRLAHMILDDLVDNYKPVIDELRGGLEEVEARVLEEETQGDLTPALMEMRSEVNELRQIIRPQREVIVRLAHGESRFVRAAAHPYFRDLRDNLVRLDETVSGFSDQLLISFDLFLSKSGYAANEGIKVLTALTALTIPGMLVGSWYGMNFTHMPELGMKYAYPVVIAVTAGLTGLIWWWCKRRGWI